MDIKHMIDCPNCGITIDCQVIFGALMQREPDDYCGVMNILCHSCGKVFKVERRAKTIVNAEYQLTGQQAAKDRVKAKRTAKMKEARAKQRIESLEELRIYAIRNNLTNNDLCTLASAIEAPV